MIASKNFLLYIILIICFSIRSNAQCVDQSNYWIESWQSCSTSQNPNALRGNSIWLLYEFSEPQAISSTQIWNANRAGESAQGAKTVFIDVSTDGTTWSQVGAGTFIWEQGSELESYEGFAGPNLQSFGFIEKILFTFLDNHESSSCISVAELRFDVDPDACYGEVDVCGNCDGPGYNTYYEDADNDGLGNPETSIEACDLPAGYVENSWDNCDNGLIGWENVSVLFSMNGCTGCHSGPGASGNLNLTSYEGISAGGDLCGPNILTGTVLVDVITISNYDGCSSPIPFPSMNERVGAAMDDEELQLIQDWINDGALLDCNCPNGSLDTDEDGVCDTSDLCLGLNDALIGTPCDDGDPCTTQEVITSNCECVGIPAVDSDFDGVCDELDLAPNDPCTADGIIGFPEPSDWIQIPSNDCDEDGVLVSLGDLNDYNECINNIGESLKPDCSCEGGSQVAGPSYLASQGISSVHYAVGVPDSAKTGYIGYKDYLDLSFPFMEIGTEICFSVGFSEPDGGVQFEVNDLGIYKFVNPNPLLADYELQTFCFNTFVQGTQKVRVSRYITGGIKIDGASFDYCPCSEGDPDKELVSCGCPNDFTQDTGTFIDSYGISSAEEAGGLPDGVFTGNIGSGDSLKLSFPAMAENYEICFEVLFTEIFGRISIDLNDINHSIVNPAGVGEENQVQEICVRTELTDAQTVIIKDIGSGTLKIDGSISKYCNPCDLDEDQDGVCDDVDLCLLGDDNMDEDGDGIPNSCDDCNGNLIGLSCNDGNDCTYNDLLDEFCNCVGTPLYHELVDNLHGALELQTIDSITLTGNFDILSDGFFQAGKSISILPGFETSEFMTLQIEIDDCQSDN